MRCIGYFLGVVLALGGCASLQHDHFYALMVQPTAADPSRTNFARQISVHVMLPSLIDRGEMVLTASDQVKILEHERWASPLLDQVKSVIGQDLEARRADLVVVGPTLAQSSLPLSKIAVEVVRFAAQRGAAVTIEARWSISDSVLGEVSGRDVFSSSAASEDYAQVPAALSACLGQLADTLIKRLPSP